MGKRIHSADSVADGGPWQGYRDIQAHPLIGSPPGSTDVPEWLSDDGLTLYFISARATGADVYVTTRAATNAPFETARLETTLSSSDLEDGLTFPSRAALEANGCIGDGYLQREQGQPPTRRWYRFFVCLGAPCDLGP